MHCKCIMTTYLAAKANAWNKEFAQAHQVFGNMNNHGSRKLVTCEPGYKLIGDSIVTCNYGQWSGDPMCVEETVSTPPEEQWVSRIRAFSSEWSSEYWSAKQVIGPPNVYPQYLDSPSAWSIGKNKLNSRTEFLELVFTKPVIVKRVDIYETFNSGSVTSLEGLHLLDDNWVILWSTVRAQHIKAARIFSPQLNVTNVFTNVIRINMDASVSQSYVEIDAVQLVGT
ncbi:hypothetical protein DPMN_131112 [Dreissena polymorpha]|uniref:Sushi domain-containing protein n=2 Tax=Dreissena polymorpha TaxID=45954 RepID=A0A9D4H903_DREPO|nr:hypothetical protein DPMN_131112 [Dreissena polymorpha]